RDRLLLREGSATAARGAGTGARRALSASPRESRGPLHQADWTRAAGLSEGDAPRHDSRRRSYSPNARIAFLPRTLSRDASAKPLTRVRHPGMSPIVCG